MTGQLADLMPHKESTAQRYYKLHEKQKSSIRAAAELPSIMRSTSTANKVSEEGTLMTKVAEANPASTEGTKENQITWNAQQIAAIRKLFQEEIIRKSVTMQEVRDKIKKTIRHYRIKTLKRSATEFAVSGVETSQRVILLLNYQEKKKLYPTK